MKINDTRKRILDAIYREMRSHPEGVGLHQSILEKHMPGEYIFDLNYLAASGLLNKDGFGNLKLTPDGIDIVEEE